MNIVKLSNVTKQYGTVAGAPQVLKGISLDCRMGEFISIMGPSGSGKTTLLNVMSTIDTATSGEVIIDGSHINTLKDEELAHFRRATVGFVFQSFNLLDNMTARDNIALPLVLGSVQPKQITHSVNKLAQLLGLENHLDKYPYELSGGQQQRIAICRALITNPKVVFADEPTGALDSKSSSEVLECFKSINKQFGTTILMVTHDAASASYSDRIIFLKDGALHGRIDSNGNKQDLFERVLNMLAVMGGVRPEHH